MAKTFLFSWTKFWSTKLVSAVIANAAPANIVLTFKSVKPFSKAVKGEFSIAGKVVDSITVNKANKTVTVTVTVAFAQGANPNLSFNPTQKGATVTQVVTNNVL